MVIKIYEKPREVHHTPPPFGGGVEFNGGRRGGECS